jgi:hypothetical protein
MTVLRPIGGRGKKQPYETKVIRVPSPLVPLIDWICDRFYEKKTSQLWPDDLTPLEAFKALNLLNLARADIIKASKAVLVSKKSARLSLEKLLQVIFGDESINL